MIAERVGVVVLVLVPLIALTQTPSAQAQSEYPWLYSFENPSLHFVFPDAEGNVIVSTGEWVRDYYYPWGEAYDYVEGGLYRIREGEKDNIEAPENTYVRDAAVDGQGRAWIMFAEATSYVYYPDVLCPQNRGGSVLGDLGYGFARFPYFVSAESDGGLGERRFGTIEEGRLLVHPELGDAIPASAEGMCCDPEGRVFVMSQQWDSRARTGYFISWWQPGADQSVDVMDLWGAIPDAWLGGYPRFGPDGLAYFLVEYHRGDSDSEYACAILALNPRTEEYELFDGTECLLLNCEPVRHSFYIDPFNTKWFGTEDGLIRFDGEACMRFTTQNSHLPYNRVRQMAYDEVDDVYYVISETKVAWDTFAMFSTFSSTGQAIGEPFSMPSAGSPWWTDEISRDAQGGVWLNPYNSDVVFYYDHEGVKRWTVADWLGEDAHVLYVSSTASGRTFCVGGGRVMVW